MSCGPDRDAIGQLITQDGGTTVIGVVGNVRHGSLEEAGGNEMYLNYPPELATGRGWRWSCAARVRPSRWSPMSGPRSPPTIPSLPSGEFYELEQLIDNAVAPRRLTTQLLASSRRWR